jgi:hypothetical protein
VILVAITFKDVAPLAQRPKVDENAFVDNPKVNEGWRREEELVDDAGDVAKLDEKVEACGSG